MSKQQLTIEHLAPYLPYDLKVNRYDAYEFFNPLDLMGFSYGKAEICNEGILSKDVALDKIKPILRQLSDLTFDHRDNLKDQYDVGVDCDSAQMFRDRDGSTNPLEWRYDDIQYLLKNHYDIFGLIDKNLAVNINNLKDE